MLSALNTPTLSIPVIQPNFIFKWNFEFTLNRQILEVYALSRINDVLANRILILESKILDKFTQKQIVYSFGKPVIF